LADRQRIEVVLADVDGRNSPESGKVESFVKIADV
jgi:hypothetical protein